MQQIVGKNIQECGWRDCFFRFFSRRSKGKVTNRATRWRAWKWFRSVNLLQGLKVLNSSIVCLFQSNFDSSCFWGIDWLVKDKLLLRNRVKVKFSMSEPGQRLAYIYWSEPGPLFYMSQWLSCDLVSFLNIFNWFQFVFCFVFLLNSADVVFLVGGGSLTQPFPHFQHLSLFLCCGFSDLMEWPSSGNIHHQTH